MKSLEQKMKMLSAPRRKKIETRAAELIAEEMSLRELRRAFNRTQSSVADVLGISQDGISRLEKRSDLLLSTLRNYIEAMGGQLNLVAKFPNRQPVALSGLGVLQGAVAATTPGASSHSGLSRGKGGRSYAGRPAKRAWKVASLSKRRA